jgi:hypothetical protein
MLANELGVGARDEYVHELRVSDDGPVAHQENEENSTIVKLAFTPIETSVRVLCLPPALSRWCQGIEITCQLLPLFLSTA